MDCPAPWCRRKLGKAEEHPGHAAMMADAAHTYKAYCESCGQEVTAPGHPHEAPLAIRRT